LLVTREADRAGDGVIRRSEPQKAKMSAVTQVNLIRPRDTKLGVANLPKMVKPASVVKQ
jgi:hypothetical protein